MKWFLCARLYYSTIIGQTACQAKNNGVGKSFYFYTGYLKKNVIKFEKVDKARGQFITNEETSDPFFQIGVPLS